MPLKGRHWLIVWLVIFVCVLLAVAARQGAAFTTARRLGDLREQRATLEARKADLERQIRLGSSREVLIPLAESTLGLHLPSDSEFTLLPVAPVPAERP